MKLAHLETHNFRSYVGTHRLTIEKPVTALIGANNSGKTNTLEALRWLNDLVHGRDRRPATAFRTLGAQADFGVSIEVDLDDADISALGGEQGDPALETLRRIRYGLIFRNSSLVSEKLEAKNGESWLVLKQLQDPDKSEYMAAQWQALRESIRRRSPMPHSNHSTNQRPPPPFSTILGPPVLRQLETRLRQWVGDWRWFAPVRAPDHKVALSQTRRVDDTGKNVLQVLMSLQTDEPELYPEVNREITQIIPALRQVKAPPRGTTIVAVAREEGGIETEIQDFGSGVQEVIILVAGLMTLPERTTVLVEEPELHLHAEAQRHLLNLLIKLGKEKGHCFILTTHSTVFAPIRDEVAVHLVTKQAGRSARRPLEGKAEFDDVRRALGHENTDLYGFRALLVVEGQTEEIAVPLLAQAMNFDFVAHGIRFVNIKGANNVTALRGLLGFAKELGVEVHLWLDHLASADCKVVDLQREGLLKQQNCITWNLDFEDLFSDQTLEAAWQHLLGPAAVEFPSAEVAKQRREAALVVKPLEATYFAANQRQLPKPAFGELLAREAVARDEKPEVWGALEQLRTKFPF